MLSEEEKKAIEKLKDFKSISILYGNTFTMFLDQLEKYQEATNTVLNLIDKLKNENEQKDKYIKNSEDITTEMKNDINKLLLEIKEKDNKVRQIINRLDNDIFRISKSKEINKWDDYRRCRLKAYKTKTKEIKEYIEQEYFKKTLKEINK